MKHIVLIGGGSGISNLLHAFRSEKEWKISAIIAMSDSGGSTGEIRREYGIPALGDLTKNLAALGESWMSLRYEDGFLMGHTAGNLWLLGLVKTYGFLPGIDHAHRLLGYTHRVIPVTETLHDIVVTKRDGTIVIGEGNIIADTDITHNIKSINLSPAVPASPEALSAIEKADILIVGPGTLYTSLIASLLPVGIKKAWGKSKAKKIYIANAANFPPGHCDAYSTDDYLSEIECWTGIDGWDAILAHDGSTVGDKQIAISDDPRMTSLPLLSKRKEHGHQYKFDTIVRNTLKHDGKKVAGWIKKNFH